MKFLGTNCHKSWQVSTSAEHQGCLCSLLLLSRRCVPRPRFVSRFRFQDTTTCPGDITRNSHSALPPVILAKATNLRSLFQAIRLDLSKGRDPPSNVNKSMSNFVLTLSYLVASKPLSPSNCHGSHFITRIKRRLCNNIQNTANPCTTYDMFYVIENDTIRTYGLYQISFYIFPNCQFFHACVKICVGSLELHRVDLFSEYHTPDLVAKYQVVRKVSFLLQTRLLQQRIFIQT